MTTFIALDTTLGACSVALFKNGVLLAERKEVRARGHVERLLPMVDEVIKETEVVINGLSAIAVTVGPGTFAGVRIGLSAAKGMALALNIPLIPITTLEALAYEFAKQEKNFTGKIAVAIDARRGELYFQIFDILDQNINPLTEAQAIPIQLATTLVDANIGMIIGSGAHMLHSLVPDGKFKVSEDYQNPTAEIFGELTLQYKEREMECDLVRPLYLRAPDAKLPAKNMKPTIKNE